MNTKQNNVLFILTSADQIGPNKRPTGYEFSEVAHPFLVFKGEDYQVDFASIKGGRPPEDGYDSGDKASTLFRDSAGFRQLNQSMRLSEVDLSLFDAIYFPGGLGPMVDMVNEPEVERAIVEIYESGRVVGSVCHGPVALMNVTMSDGTGFLSGKSVAAFTEAEEQGHSEKDVPFMLDSALQQQGAKHTSAPSFEPHVVIDDRLITGQNPASAAGVARAMIRVIAKHQPVDASF